MQQYPCILIYSHMMFCLSKLYRYASSFHFFTAAIAQNPKCAKLYMLLGGEPLPYTVGGAIYYHTP